MKRWQIYTIVLTIQLALLMTGAVTFELSTSSLQSKFFSALASEVRYEVRPGRSDNIIFPGNGPFDKRLGYTSLPDAIGRLRRRGYVVDSQAVVSPRFRQLVELGVFPTYHEKHRAGLRIVDDASETIYQVLRPEYVFKDFESIPPIVVATLLYIENREILDGRFPNKNPAVEWDRLGKAVLEKAIQEIYPDRSAPGGSTLATQLEKYRHTPDGLTLKPSDKLQQMISASFRAYLDGPDTMPTRKQIVLAYINSIPLAALPGYGEVNGLGDGLWAWYNLDVGKTAELLRQPFPSDSEEKKTEWVRAYKQVLSLFIAHRRPSQFLLTDVNILNRLTDDYLQLLTASGIINTEIRDRAMELDLELRVNAPPPPAVSFVDRKAVNAIRTRLLDELGLAQLYDLDQFDLRVESTILKRAQSAITEVLRSLSDKKNAEQLGLTGERTLDQGDTSKVIYSVTLYEHVDGMNYLRVQTDNYDKPFSINEGTKLDLGSTAKLRVLSNYLLIISDLYQRLSPKSKLELQAELQHASDPISRFAIEFLLGKSETSLAAMLDAAMERRYSANPGETFFTGGGVHHFVNFKNEDNGKVPTVQEAIRHSINLPFIRLMRDIVRYYMAQIPGSPTRIDDAENLEARKVYLAKFADKEGSYFLEQFYKKYRRLSPEDILSTLFQGMRVTPLKLAVVFRYIEPNAPLSEFQTFVSKWLPNSTVSLEALESLYEKHGPEAFSLQDKGYLAKVHPLELWLVGYLMLHPQTTFAEVLSASTKERQEVYQWLFRPKLRAAQEKRIRTLVEQEAFLEIHRVWKKLGYPFQTLVPSYATAIGSSGDRPAALAELIGIIVNGGIHYPKTMTKRLRFAAETPFETNVSAKKTSGNRVMPPEVAKRLREAIVDVVERGTARRVFETYTGPDGRPLVIGGKTGTGDHRYETFGRGGQLTSSRVVNRTATFAFFIADRWFGVVSAHVQGEEAAKYDFTSALAAGLLKALATAINPVVNEAIEQQPLRSLSPEQQGIYARCLGFATLPALMRDYLEQYVEDLSVGEALFFSESCRARTKDPAKRQPLPAA